MIVRASAVDCAGVNNFGLLRAPKSDGQEAIVFVTSVHEWDSLQSLALGAALFRHMSSVPWLAKDIIWLVADARECAGGEAAVRAWLNEYHSSSHLASKGSSTFRRSGVIIAGMNLEFNTTSFHEIEVSVECDEGTLPNLDIYSLAQHMIRQRAKQTVTLQRFNTSILSGITKSIMATMPKSQEMASIRKSLDSWVYQMSIMSRFLYNQVVGRATGAHGPFKHFSIDAVTIRAKHQSPTPSRKQISDDVLFTGIGGLLEGMVGT